MNNSHRMSLLISQYLQIYQKYKINIEMLNLVGLKLK